jgi:putative Holliday junction resolvase
MRILGIDYGDVHLGLAVSDRLLITAQPLGKYQLKSKQEDRKYFQDLIAQHEIGKIVIGLPLRMDGTPGTRVKKTEEFAEWMKAFLDIPIIFWDERLTTKQALGILQAQRAKPSEKKRLKEQISATLILASYLESIRDESHGAQNS